MINAFQPSLNRTDGTGYLYPSSTTGAMGLMMVPWLLFGEGTMLDVPGSPVMPLGPAGPWGPLGP